MKVIGIVVLISTLLLRVKCARPHMNPIIFKIICTKLLETGSGMISDFETKINPAVADEDLMNNLTLFKEKIKGCQIACREIDDVILPPRLQEEVFISDEMINEYGLNGKIDLKTSDRKIYYFIDKAFEVGAPLIQIIKHILLVCLITGDFSNVQEFMKNITPNQSGFTMNGTIISISIPLILVISSYLFA